MSGVRTRWAAVGAAVSISLGAGGIGLANAELGSGQRAVSTAITACRLADTRTGTQVGAKSGAFGPGETVTFLALGSQGECTIPSDVTALNLNVTAVDATRPTFLTFWDTGQLPNASSLNPVPGQPPTPNAVTVNLAGGRFKVYNLQGNVDVIIDIVAIYQHHHHDDRYYTKTQTDTALATKTDATAFAGHDHYGETWTGSGSVGLAVTGDVGGAGGPSLISGINTHTSGSGERQYGVYGEVQSSGLPSSDTPPQSAGVYGRGIATDSSYSGYGVVGHAGTNTDLWKPVGAVGVVGLGDSRGLYGSSGTSYGAYATSLNWYGVYGRTSRPDNNYGVYTPDNLFAASITTAGGMVAAVMQNTSSEALDPGDIVSFTGIGDPIGDSTLPTAAVASAGGSRDVAVAGVVLSRFDPEAADIAPDDPGAPADLDPTPDGQVAPGEYLLVVVQGPAQVNMAASIGDLQPGALVAAASDGDAGVAQGAEVDGEQLYERGSVLGKALEPLRAGQDRAWIYVTLN